MPWLRCEDTSNSAANPVLPKAKPRTMREHFIVSSIRSQEVARTQRSGVRRCEDMLKPLDFGNGLLGIHSVPISSMSTAKVKRSGIRMSCLPEPSCNKANKARLLAVWGKNWYSLPQLGQPANQLGSDLDRNLEVRHRAESHVGVPMSLPPNFRTCTRT